jgi:membrane-associated protein
LPDIHLDEILKTIGYVGIFAIIFAESGLLFGIILPGDSLLFTAGFLASQGFFNIGYLAVICVLGAILGDSVGYSFGRRVGRRLFDRPDSRFFKQKHLRRVEAFYETHGGKTIILARFLPVVRTLAPIVAGVGVMNYRRFLAYNVIGGILWGAGVTVAGYLLGATVPEEYVDRFLIPIILLIVVASALPTIVHVAREYLATRREPRREP